MITSLSNSQIKRLQQLKKKGKERDREDVFLVEGIKMFQEAPGNALLKTYVSAGFYADEHRRKLLRGFDAEVVSDSVFAAVSDTKTPQGILCLVRQFHYSFADLTKGKAPLCLVLENVQDPGNLGTIVRSAEGAGASGILLSDGCADLYNPKVIRSTMGSIYRMPFFCTGDLAGAIQEWKRQGLTVFAAHLDGDISYDREDYRGPCAFLIGNESRGLTPETAKLADRLIRIPMCGQVESLNAAVAASVLLYEGARQRRAGVKEV